MNVTIIYYQGVIIKIRSKSHNLYTRLFSLGWWYFLETIRKSFNNDSAIELPINIVVMLVVGMGSPL